MDVFSVGMIVVLFCMALVRFVVDQAKARVNLLYPGLCAGLLAAVVWLVLLRVRRVAPNLLFGQKTDGELAYIGTSMVLFAQISQKDDRILLLSVAFTTACWFFFMDRSLKLPDDEWLRKHLEADRNDHTVEVDDETGTYAETSTRPRRLEGFEKGLLRYDITCGPECTTAQAILRRSKALFKDNQMMGSRKVLNDGSFGPYVFRNYETVMECVDACSYHLTKTLGQNRVGVLAKNCEEFVVLMFAALQAGVVLVPLYDTLGKHAIKHIVEHAELDTVFCSEENLDTVLSLKSDATADPLETCPLVRVVVFKDRTLRENSPACADRGPRKDLGLDIIPFETILSAPEGDNVLDLKAVNEDDLALILYTSGTTGVPKGVMLTQGSIVASSSALLTSVDIRATDVHLSYLPLAHAFELAVIMCGVMRGASVGFFHGNVKELTEDAKVLRPTIFAGVPRVFQRVRQVILQQIALKPAPIRWLCYHAIQAQIDYIRTTGSRSMLYDLLVFRNVQAALGGRVRVMCTGSAALAPSIQEFIKACFNCPIVEGYGMTETSGVCHAMLYQRNFQDVTVGSVGPPLACSEYKLASAPELKYSIDDVPRPQGEILVRGPNIFKGYFKNPEMTKDVLVNGWLHTGDIGRINANGSLSIVDRKKSLFKLAQGEYISPELIEAKMLEVPAVGQVFVHGTSSLPHLVAIVVPDPLELIPRLSKGAVKDIQSGELPILSPQLDTWLGKFHTLCTSSRTGALIKQYILDEMTEAARAAALPKFMWVRDIIILSDLNELLQGFSVENDMLTPTFKYKRNVIAKKFDAELSALLENIPEKPTPATAYPPASKKTK